MENSNRRTEHFLYKNNAFFAFSSVLISPKYTFALGKRKNFCLHSKIKQKKKTISTILEGITTQTGNENLPVHFVLRLKLDGFNPREVDIKVIFGPTTWFLFIM